MPNLLAITGHGSIPLTISPVIGRKVSQSHPTTKPTRKARTRLLISRLLIYVLVVLLRWEASTTISNQMLPNMRSKTCHVTVTSRESTLLSAIQHQSYISRCNKIARIFPNPNGTS
ncbi:hypothetical protein AVEN_67530-1 [Araneus ventricosus]|uniref:Uncharacterized protein n=1 Tax=Araneus ventricosus TaxID=182803 RepID=A0A4Y2CMQ6_ARAVE|nr:hypothetical protein AVEN_175549-1 [Araneus ventricosus]GBO35072.1 hypothetical protein AVEN_67530-1 [Araneus ventricosus]